MKIPPKDKKPLTLEERRGIGPNRRWHFQPVWRQFGFDSQAHYDLNRWGEGLCRLIVKGNSGGDRWHRANDALFILNKRRAEG